MNHRWKDNICIHCGLHREKRGWRLLMAISHIRPYNHYLYGSDWYYGEVGYERPECKQFKQQSKL